MSDLDLFDARGKDLPEKEAKRLERALRSRQNRRGRRQPVRVPPALTRTSAFAPRRNDLVDDKNFKRVYVVSNRSIVLVEGRELGSQHRDAVYAMFRLPQSSYKLQRREAARAEIPGLGGSGDQILEATGTWRDLLRLMRLTEHVNNVLTLLGTFQELRSVNLRVFEGSYGQYVAAEAKGRLTGAGFSDGFVQMIEWDGPNLDSKVTIRYGEWVQRMFEKKHLVSLNSEVYYSLSSDHAKSFWPFLDSQPGYTWVDESVLGELVGKDPQAMTVSERRWFREACRFAFEDMKRAGGLASWRVEIMGSGRRKTQRYHYVHALPREIERQPPLPLAPPGSTA